MLRFTNTRHYSARMRGSSDLSLIMAPNVKVLLKILNILLLRHVSEATEPINWIYISCNGKI